MSSPLSSNSSQPHPLGHNVQPNRQALQPTPHSKCLLNIPAGHKLCSRCLDPKPFDQFFKRNQTALQDENQMPLSQTCASCRLAQKARDAKNAAKRREAKDKEKEASFESYTWENIVAKIDDGYSKTLMRLTLERCPKTNT